MTVDAYVKCATIFMGTCLKWLEFYVSVYVHEFIIMFQFSWGGVWMWMVTQRSCMLKMSMNMHTHKNAFWKSEWNFYFKTGENIE